MVDITENLLRIKATIAEETLKWQRNANDITLLAVSKGHDKEAIIQAIHAGIRQFGENRVQEAKEKWASIKTDYPDIQIHLIGPLQTNKVKEACALFDVIETLDREKLAITLSKQPNCPPLYIQINVGEESQKSGFSPLEVDDFITYAQNDLALPIIGVMSIPPLNEPPSPYFALTTTIARRHNLKHISMGMSGDFPKAIALGATEIRVGSNIFGPRP